MNSSQSATGGLASNECTHYKQAVGTVYIIMYMLIAHNMFAYMIEAEIRNDVLHHPGRIFRYRLYFMIR